MIPALSSKEKVYEICVIGLGPSGLGAAFTFSKSEIGPRVICINQGGLASDRACSVLQNGTCKGEEPCQMICGFGGSSLLGGGKISAFPAGSGLAAILADDTLADKRLRKSIRILSAHLPLRSPDVQNIEINHAAELFKKLGFEYKYFDVYQFDHEDLRSAYDRIHSYFESVGMSVLLNTRLIDANREGQGFRLTVRQNSEEFAIHAKLLVLGLGRSGQRTIRHINTKLDLGGKEGHLDVGVRLEFPTELFPIVSLYHRDLKLLFDGARTFCVCKNGRVSPYVIDGVLFAEGNYSPRDTSKFTNLGILIRLEPFSHNETVLDDIRQRALKHRKGKLLCQRLTGYLDNALNKAKPIATGGTSCSFWDSGNVNDCFPPSVSVIVRQAVQYFAERLLPRERWEEVKVFGPEVDYSGVSFPVKSDFSILPGIFIIGDCTGRFRGIAQAFCSGIICAEKLMGKSDHGKNFK